jgi:hypothetical protein
MGRVRFAWGRVLVVGGLVSGALLGAGCAGYSNPPFPVDPDPCATYCLKYVPPVYREVPRVTMTKAPCSRSYQVCTIQTKVRTVCKPGECKTVCVPDECRQTSIVQVEPAREEWRRVECEDCYGCEIDCCFRRVRVPPKYDVCPRCEVDEGFTYCVQAPPTYETVVESEPCTQTRCEYVPAEYGICYDKQCWTPGHWVWEKRDCAFPEPCPPTAICAPQPTPGEPCPTAACPPVATIKRVNRPTWGRCPPAD